HAGTISSVCRNLRRTFLVCFDRNRLGLINAEWLLVHEVSGRRIRSCPTAHTDVAKFAAPTFSLQAVCIAQPREHLRILPNLGKRLLAQVSRQRRQVSTGENFALVRKEAHTRSRQAAFRHRIHALRMSAPRLSSLIAARMSTRERNSRGSGHCHLGRPDVSR